MIRLHIIFDKSKCVIEIASDTLIVGKRFINIYTIDIACTSSHDKCFLALHDDNWLWHRRLGHANAFDFKDFFKNDLVKSFPKIGFQKHKVYDACLFEKQVKTSFNDKNHISTLKPLQLLHLNLFAPFRYASISGKYYAFTIIDDFSKYT